MKILLLGINAKYIHSNLAIRLMHQSLKKDAIESDILEVTIKDTMSDVVCICEQYDVVAIGVYIWNTTFVQKLTSKLIKPKIILGGPEATYETQEGLKKYHYDFLVRGSGELSINQIIHHLLSQQTLPTYIQTKHQQATTIFEVPLEYVMSLESPYKLFSKHEFETRVIYFEASRGCPFTCSYCLSSLEENVKVFDDAYLKTELSYVLKYAKTIKFLDRTFNFSYTFVATILNIIRQHANHQQSIQFECKAEFLSDEMIYLLKSMNDFQLRFEIGIQSTDNLVNQSVDRIQDFNIVSTNIIKLQNNTRIDLHLDLIAGLPYEDLNRFSQTFNEVMQLKPLELQLGILKILKGTKLASQVDLYKYSYHLEAPYEIIANEWLSKDELMIIKQVEKMVELFWNHSYLQPVLRYHFNQITDYFSFFLELAKYIETNAYDMKHFHDRTHALLAFLSEQNDVDLTLMKLLIDTYYMHYKVKPKALFSKQAKKIKRYLVENTDFMLKNKLDNEILYKYGCVESYQMDGLLHIHLYIYQNHKVTRFYVSLKERIHV